MVFFHLKNESPETTRLDYAQGQRVWLEKTTRKGDIIAVVGEIVEILPDGQIRIKEPYSEPIAVLGSNNNGLAGGKEKSEPEGLYKASDLDEWRGKYGLA